MASLAQEPRRYRGLTASQRRAQRREQLLDAGLELFGTLGYANTTIRAVSAAASMNSRHFYESFASREDLLYHVYERIVHEIVLSAAEETAKVDTLEGKARAGLRAGWTIVTDDRRKARVVALEVVGVSERLDRLRRQIRHSLADLTANNARSIAGPKMDYRLDPVLTARTLIGGVVEVLIDWINGDVDASVDEIVEHFTRLFTAVAIASVAPDPRSRAPRSQRAK
ncbi:MAG TPA: TetR/AcrR family transcriptional regulator [Solirubrobacteraceae bacterium]|nr:TetR/AcrR family transcriptional regulator [Solirubrobacteraceae bacterium]